jgi:two-component system, sensor histidine kinase PdtaS
MTDGTRTPWSPPGQLEAFLEAAPDPIVVIDDAGTIRAANPAAERMFRLGRGDLIGRPAVAILPDLDPSEPSAAVQELTGIGRGGDPIPVELSLGTLADGARSIWIGILRDIRPRRAAEAAARASVREKEALVQEIHHRVKNNLQVISSLLKLQSQHIVDPQAREMFAESQHRIRSMALVHEKLYQSSDLARVNIRDYVASLAVLLLRSFGVDSQRIRFAVTGDDVYLGIDAAVPCGLIVNELLSNCFKHAFPDGRAGSVEVRVDGGDHGRFTVSVEDDGAGLPPHVDLVRADTLGLQLVRTLADQLHGEIEVVRRRRGVGFRIHGAGGSR